MKRIALTVLFIMFLCLSFSTPVCATAFSIIDGTFEITGELSYLDEGSHSVGQYYKSSTSPVSYRIDDMTYQPSYESYQQSTASWSYVGFEGYTTLTNVGSKGTAKSTVRFMSAFDGILGKDISFYGIHDWDSTSPFWTLTDLTTGTLLALNSPDLPDEFSQPFVLGDQWDQSPYTVGHAYDWDSTHVYELELFVNDSTDFPHEHEWVATNMFVVNVPEPSTILLIGAGLIGLAGYRAKKARS